MEVSWVSGIGVLTRFYFSVQVLMVPKTDEK
jgi:hypothetical protein